MLEKVWLSYPLYNLITWKWTLQLRKVVYHNKDYILIDYFEESCDKVIENDSSDHSNNCRCYNITSIFIFFI